MKFLDRYVSDEGAAMITELRRVGTGGKATKGDLQFLCFGAAQALEVARQQHAAVARKAKAEGYSEGSAARWRCAEEHFNGSGECGPDSWDCRCPNPYREEATQ